MSHYMNIDGALRLAEVLRTLGDKAGARAAYEDAIARVEADRPHTPEDQRASFLSKHGAVYRALIDLLWQTDGAAAAERAFALAEASRARTLLDALRASGVDGAAARPRTPAEIRAALAPGELLLVFVTATDATYGFVVSRDALRWTRLAGAGGVAALTDRVAFFRKQVVEAESDDAVTSAGGALYQDLLAPLVDDAPAGTLLVIAPDGPLHLLPFDALWRAASHELIAERFDVAMTPSGSLLADPGTAAAPRAILAIADPPDDAGLGPLPDSAREVDDALAKLDGDELLLRGRDATEARLKAASPGAYAILHFATHATVDDALPLRSALVLGGGGGDDGRLTAAEIYRMQLRTGVVVLSACQSAVGDVAGAEGPMSLARAFLHAGAGSVVATLWQIEDRGAARLMDRFYDELASGDATARALGEAKRAMIAAGAPPRSWAAFVATGLPSRAPGVTARARGGFPIRWGLAAALVIAVAFVGIRLVGIRRARNR
ncbi:MAG: CHAT domain-containing protein [Deltaproteobacteria bacterium]|nr:CHAT domain-containing protein [Deltaproteobacteria bacterium]